MRCFHLLKRYALDQSKVILDCWPVACHPSSETRYILTNQKTASNNIVIDSDSFSHFCMADSYLSTFLPSVEDDITTRDDAPEVFLGLKLFVGQVRIISYLHLYVLILFNLNILSFRFHEEWKKMN